MPRSQRHPLALFSLYPLNDRAIDVVNHQINEHFVSYLRGVPVLDIGHIRPRARGILATLGRGDVDIYVPGSTIAQVQCSFKINPDTNIVMFYDESTFRTSQVYGQNATPFDSRRIRKVVVHPELNTEIGIGGKRRNLVKFRLIWHESNAGSVTTLIKMREHKALDYEDNPRNARTLEDVAETVVPSRWTTRIHTPGPNLPTMRYMTVGRILGEGTFGKVYRAINVDTGKAMAVKILRAPRNRTAEDTARWRQTVWYALKRDVETLAKIEHPHIVDYLMSQGWGESPSKTVKVEIFMGLKEGTLGSLVRNTPSNEKVLQIAQTAFEHMLKALDCLAYHGIIHRDVKPENILYITGAQQQFQFQLGDFGLCNRDKSATNGVGTPLYTAPEVLLRGMVQTDKADVWSLFVTMLWVLDLAGFREKSANLNIPIHSAVLQLACYPDISTIKEMAFENPEQRASAAQMLVKCFGGRGLTTPRDKVPDLATTAGTDTAKRRLSNPATPRPGFEKRQRGWPA